MRITFLGTGPSRAIPRPDHDDALCRAARHDPKSRRLRSSAIVASGGASVLIDAGPDVTAQLASRRLGDIAALLLTHAHVDAMAGVATLDRRLLALGHRIPLIAHPGALRRLPKLLALHPTPARRMRIGPLSVTPIPVTHGGPGFPTLGYSFGKALAYASDVGAIPAASRRLLMGTRTLALDAAAWIGRRIPNHLHVEMSIAIAGELGVRRLVLTQVGHTWPPYGIAKKELARALAPECPPLPNSVVIAYDGLIITAK